jgi:hypothetical protein
LKKTLDNLGGGSILILKDFGKTKLLLVKSQNKRIGMIVNGGR